MFYFNGNFSAIVIMPICLDQPMICLFTIKLAAVTVVLMFGNYCSKARYLWPNVLRELTLLLCIGINYYGPKQLPSSNNVLLLLVLAHY